ncbi:OmpA family protein [Corticibacter populi]|uniref:OmpA family protein n=1 Tax=Corticibacter populi TaxID=1550736 RepID=A0A3M6QTQ4_9BURK|nr:OmpA family protein [Corticibacter populi]RMX06387.1 OmpA family protein [Corticibacter populi]RZS32067.1 OmpA family protein [Corticibacter populi]
MAEQKDSETRVALLLVSALIAAVVGGVVWFGASTVVGKQPAGSTGTETVVVETVGTTPTGAVVVEREEVDITQVAAGEQSAVDVSETVAVAVPAAGTAEIGETAAADDEARVVVEDGVVKFYFAVGKADIAPGAAEALLDVITATNSGKRAIISGYTDASGNAEINEALAKQRAEAVREQLVALGVPAERLELRKPEALTGTGNAAEARRVEVRLED